MERRVKVALDEILPLTFQPFILLKLCFGPRFQHGITLAHRQAKREFVRHTTRQTMKRNTEDVTGRF